MRRFTSKYIALRRFSTSAGSPSVLMQKKGVVATIIINRPDFKNAVNFECAELLAKTMKEFDEDPSIKVGVLYGNGGTFCAGADLKAIGSGNFNRLEDTGNAPMGISRMKLTKPLIAAISGYAVAGGLELACLCDLRVVEEDAIMGVFCRRFGVPLIDGGTVRLPRLIGLSRAMDLILTGRPVDAQEALLMGLANRVVPKGHSRQAAEELATQIAAFPQECMLADRDSAFESQHLSLEEGLKYEFSGGKPIAQHKLKEGVERFIRKEYKR